MENFKIKSGILILLLNAVFNGLFSQSFYMSVNRIFSTTDVAEFSLETYQIDGKVSLRAYKIEDPINFFKDQKNISSPELVSFRDNNAFQVINNSITRLVSDIKSAGRRFLNDESRDIIKSVIKTDKKEINSGSKNQAELFLDKYKFIKEWALEVKPKSQYYNYSTCIIPINMPGVYLLEARYKNLIARTVCIISDYVLITKRIKDDLLLSCFDRKTGKSVSGIELEYYVEGEKVNSKTIKNGFAQFKTVDKSFTNSEKKDEEWDEVENEFSGKREIILGGDENNFLIYDPDNNYYYSEDDTYDNFNIYPTYFYTDKPIYRPGQEVYFKSVTFKRQDNGSLKSYQGDWASFEVRDPANKLVKQDSMLLNEYGSINGKLNLSIGCPLGFYSVNIKVAGKIQYYYFEVQEYKKPEFKVEVRFDNKQYFNGEELTGKINARYFFGSPVQKGEVQIYLYKSKYYIPWWRGEDDEWFLEQGDEEYYGQFDIVQTGVAVLDNKGEAVFRFPTEQNSEDDFTYLVKAEVVDNSRISITGSKTIMVSRGDYFIRTNFDKYFYSINEDISIKTEVFDFSNKKISSDYKLVIQKINYYYETVVVDTVINKVYKENYEDVKTLYGKSIANQESIIKTQISKDGSYRVLASVKDKSGREIIETNTFYVSKEGSDFNWNLTSQKEINIIPDKKTYNQGEKVKLMIISPVANIDLLFTVECDKIYEKRIIHLDEKTYYLELDAQDIYAPNVFLSLNGILGNDQLSGSKRITVKPKQKFLKISISYDKKEYKPQEEGIISINVKDETGSPVKNTELSCGLVDEAIYSLKEEASQDIGKFFYSIRYNKVATSFSNERYFYGYSKKMRIDEYGDLLDPMKKSFLAGRSDKRKNLFYGDIKSTKINVENVRRDFRDLVVFVPNIYTDGDGNAKVKVRFPDNLTAWRTTVKGVTTDAAVGNTTSQVISKKNLMLTMITPRYYTEGDKSLLTTQIHNITDQDKNVLVSVQGSNLKISEKQKTVFIPKGGIVSLDWNIEIGGESDVKMKAYAKSDKDYDAMEITIPVQQYGLKTTKSCNLELESKKNSFTKEIVLENYNRKNPAELKIDITPSVGGLIISSLDELIGYPYGCVEQTMSRFLPTLIVAKTLSDLSVPFNEKKKNELPLMIKKGINRLADMRNEENAWGWWKGEQSDPYMTAYVVYGLKLAEKNGYEVPSGMVRGGCDYLNKIINDSKIDIIHRAYALYSLSFTGYLNKEKQKDFIIRISNSLLNKSREPKVLAYLSIALKNYGLNNEAVSLANELDTKSSNFENMKFWSTNKNEYYLDNDETELAALGLEAFLLNNFEKWKVEKIINYLVNNRDQNSWRSTKQTASVILAVSVFMKKYKEDEPDYTLKLFVEGNLFKELKVSKNDLFKESLNFKTELKNLKNDKIKISAQLFGKGKAYVTANASYLDKRNTYLAGANILSIDRQYQLLEKTTVDDRIIFNSRSLDREVKSGDILLVKLTVNSPLDLKYVMIEEPLLAAGEVITNEMDYKIKGINFNLAENYFDWYDYTYHTKEIRDQKICIFINDLPKKKKSFYYILRVQIPGVYNVMPATTQLMYYPKIRGNSKNEKFMVQN